MIDTHGHLEDKDGHGSVGTWFDSLGKPNQRVSSNSENCLHVHWQQKDLEGKPKQMASF